MDERRREPVGVVRYKLSAVSDDYLLLYKFMLLCIDETQAVAYLGDVAPQLRQNLRNRALPVVAKLSIVHSETRNFVGSVEMSFSLQHS